MTRLLPLMLLFCAALVAAPAHARPRQIELKPVPDRPPMRQPPPRQQFAKPPPPRNRCLQHTRSTTVVYLEQTRSLYRGRVPSPRIAPHPRRRRRPYTYRSGVTVYSNGMWSRYGGRGRARRGCLNPTVMRRLRRLLRRARFRSDPRRVPVCAAVPSMVTTISAGRRSYTFRHPCGNSIHPSLVRLRRFVAMRAR